MIDMVALAAVILVAAGGYWVVQARAGGGGAAQARATVAAAPRSTQPRPADTEHWTVGKLIRPSNGYAQPRAGARVVAKLGLTTANGFPTLVLVNQVRTVGDETWYRVWVAQRPNGTRVWLKGGALALYETRSRITIDLSRRELVVYRKGVKANSFDVAVGGGEYPTPTGFFFINQKLKPPSAGGPYGVLALGLSAFQPKLAHWPQGGPVAIHGTNEPLLIGKAVSHGCVRMRNRDILAVSRLVPTGSPVVIKP